MDSPLTDPTWSGGVMTERTTCVLCPNPSPMTLDGTNTWIVAEPGSDEVVVVDPGPLDEAHLDAVMGAVRSTDRRVALTLLTHHHSDHAESADRFAELTGAPVRGVGRGHDDLTDGDVVRVGGLELLCVHTPGHTADSFSFVVTADNTLLTGDTILGRGTTVVAYPDGDLTSYLESLERIQGLTQAGVVVSLTPGHGPYVPDAAELVAYYRAHRVERLEQVRVSLENGARTPREVVEDVYRDVPQTVWPAAELSVRAQLAYLEREPSRP